MLRFISILLLIGGMLAAGLGGAMLLELSAPRTAVAPFEAPVSATPSDGEPVSSERGAAQPSDRLEAEEAEIARSVDAANGPDSEVIASPSAESTGDDDYAFQPMMESMESAPAPAFDDDAGVRPTEEQYAAATAPPRSLIDTLRTVPIAHEAPRSAEYKRPFDVTFAIDATGDATAVDAMPGRGVIETGEARVSEQVEVRLSGANFSIMPSSPPVQSMSPLTENVWRWSVTPLTAGNHDLVFEVFAMSGDTTVPLRTFRDTVTVKVTGLNLAIAFADQANPLFVLLGGLGSAIAGLFGALKFFGKK